MRSFDGILRNEWLRENSVILDYSRKCVLIGVHAVPFVQEMEAKTMGLKVHVVSECSEREEPIVKYLRLYAVGSAVCPAHTTGVIEVRCAASHKIPQAIVERGDGNSGLIIGCALLDMQAPRVYVPFLNVSDEEVVVKPGEIVAQAREWFDQPLRVAGNINFLGQEVEEKFSETKLKAVIKDVIKNSECPGEMQAELEKLLWANRGCLANKHASVGYCDRYQPGIPLDTDDVVYTPQYPGLSK